MATSTAKTPFSILVINPNSSKAMTQGLKRLLSNHQAPSLTYAFFTAPPEAPLSINNEQHDEEQSTKYCISQLSPDVLARHDAFIVACYSRHGLVDWLEEQAVVREARKPVHGIFSASILRSVQLLAPGEKYGIVSTGKYWEKAISEGIQTLKPLDERARALFAGVETTGLDANELHELPEKKVNAKLAEATKRMLRKGPIGAICLGCAGMAGMDKVVFEAAVEEVGLERAQTIRVVDGIVAAVDLIQSERE